MSYHPGMNRSSWAAAAAALCAGLLSGCMGTVPTLNGEPEQGISSVIIGGRVITPLGETRSAKLWINLETDGGRDAEVYRLPVRPQEALLYQVEPGVYHVAPTRNLLGWSQPVLKITVEGRAYKVPFPRELLRKGSLDIKPTKIVPIGVLDVVVEKALPGRPPIVRMSLDDSVDARRGLVQQLIRAMMDPNAPADMRRSAIAWTRALDQTLVEVLAEPPREPLYKAVR